MTIASKPARSASFAESASCAPGMTRNSGAFRSARKRVVGLMETFLQDRHLASLRNIHLHTALRKGSAVAIGFQLADFMDWNAARARSREALRLTIGAG